MSGAYVGQRYFRPDSIGKVTGAAQYTADLAVRKKGILIAKVYRIDCARAKILRVDVSEAKKVPGVVAVLTAEDIPQEKKYGYVAKDKPIIAGNETLCDSDAVAFVAAETEEAAKSAVKLIRVEYEPLPAVEDPIKGMEEGAEIVGNPLALSKQSNVSNDVRVARGDMKTAFAKAAVVIDRDFKTPMVEHACLEPDIAIAEPDSLNGGLTFYCPVQNVHGMREGLCDALNMPVSKIRVISPPIGGAFGGKECSSVDCGAVAGVLALHTGRPVMYEMTREEIFRYTSKRHRSYIHYRLGADENGQLLAMQADAVFDKGAYKSVDVIPHRSALLGAGPYYIPAADVHNRSVFTNHVYGGAFRGLGAPQQHYALECAMEDMALALGMDPIEFRLKNIVREGVTTIFGQNMSGKDEAGIRQCILSVREKLDWENPPDNSDPYRKRGRGIACYMYGTGSSFPKDSGHVYVELNVDGSLNVNLAQNEMGQGIIAAMTQIAADALGILPENVNIGISDSRTAPEAGPTSASRATVFQGNAVISACSALKARIVAVAARMLGESADQLEVKDGVIYLRKAPNKRITLREAAAQARVSQVPLAEVGDWYPPKTEKDPTNLNQTTRWVTFAYGAHGVEVEVDTRNGIVTVLRSVHAIDVGKAINPSTVEGQMDGATTQAFGWALMEEEFLKEGKITGASFHEYLIPTVMDMPELESIIIETESELGPYGAKGIGEPTILGGAPALRNAILNATGVAFYEIPMTPVRVMAALQARDQAQQEERTPYFRAPLEK